MSAGFSSAQGSLGGVAAVASSLRGAAVLRVGTWFPGYLDVESSSSDLERLGAL